MIRVSELSAYKMRLEATRRADEEHTAIMTKLCAKSGITLGKFRAMSEKDQEKFAAKHWGKS